MHLINVETLRLETFVGDNIPPYAILSHTWGADEEEVSFEDIWSGNLEKPGNRAEKLKGCCNQAKEDHLEYAWIDTCCIDKKSSKELDEAINSMFQWYKKASICYTYLSDVPHGDDSWDPGSKFFSSRWFQRGWTLQELLAPEELRFYNREWISIGRRRDMSNEVERITGISREFLLGWEDFRKAGVAQRMSWAAKRKTSRKEDSAYCLLGIFDVTMPMIYGEGDRALSRLQQEIMKITGDHSILAWGLDTAEYTPSNSAGVISAGILATAPSDFANCGHIVPRKQDATPINTFDISSGRLRMHLSIHTTSAGETFGLLNCGPEHNAEQVVGIPVYKAVSGAATGEYLRPQGRSSVLLPRTATRISTKHIHIQMGRQNRAHEAMGRRLWLHIDGHQKMNLEEEIYPPVHWEKARTLIAEANDSDGQPNITRRYLARFRTQGERSQDVIVVLEFEMHGLQPQARCHVMTSSRDTALEDLFQNFIYLRPEALGKQATSNGKLNVEVTVKEEQVAQEPMFVVRLAPASNSLEAPVDANWELYQVNLKLEFVRILQKEDQVRLETRRLAQQRDKEMATLDRMRERLAVIEEDLRKLGEEKRALSDGVEEGAQQVDELTNRLNEGRQQQDEWSRRESEIQRRLDELETKQGPGNWLETTIKTQLGTGQIGRGLKDAGDLDPRAVESGHNIDSQTPLLWAVMNRHEAVVRLLREKRRWKTLRDRLCL
ncbi:heterokaryon incompatibility protein-domain-containing protein [Dactylonectria macrodidyma]|uniref:Heterokaryon incompatibility protein-domain-containing protein n=1 Tax=Dactylonectria macrodidyma TaxID=307937 RepID=A0A9P9FGW2_9HYPO|nr:heterokaryon incompatibility protein-domain-containing protein [Dactylonectria macrodidyma]